MCGVRLSSTERPFFTFGQETDDAAHERDGPSPARQGASAPPADVLSLVSVARDVDFQALAVRLADGTTVTVRAIRADDADRLQAAVRSLSAESQYSRFFSSMSELTPQLLDRATHPDAGAELQLVAVCDSGSEETIIGGARYGATATPGDCEFAVAVVDAWQGRGLARTMVEALMQEARARGFARMEGYILATNTAMLGLAKRLGFVRVHSPEGPSICRVQRDLATVG